MKKLASYAGAAGLSLLAAGVLIRILQPGRDRLGPGFLVAGLALLVVFLASHRRAVGRFALRRSAREGANAAGLAFAVVGIVVAINYIAGRHPSQWDFTAARQYTLSDQTTKILEGLDRDVEIVLLDNPTSSRALVARDLLELYDNASERVGVSVVDPEARPEKALSYQDPGDPAVDLGTVLLVTGERRERATAATEPEITNALLRLVREERKKIYFTSGHQEKSLDDTDPDIGLSVLKTKLEASTYETEGLLIARTASPSGEGVLRIPDDAAALVVAGPRSDFLPEEMAAIDRYLGSGGKAVFLIDPETQGATSALAEYLLEKGIDVEDDVVVDPYSLPPLYPVVRSYGRHPIVESFSNALSVFPLARSVGRSEDVPEGAEVRELFSSEEGSWGETRLSELPARQGPAPDQRRGPLSLAVAGTLPAGSTGDGEDAASKVPAARLVVVGDSDFVSNELVSAPLLNADLFLNMVNWVAQDEDLIAIRPREPEDRRIFLSPQQSTNVLLLSLLVIPGVILVTGISVWWGRR